VKIRHYKKRTASYVVPTLKGLRLITCW